MIRMKMQMHILAVCSGRSHPFSQGKKVNRVLQRTTKLNELYLRNESAEAVRVNLKLAKPNRGGGARHSDLPARKVAEAKTEYKYDEAAAYCMRVGLFAFQNTFSRRLLRGLTDQSLLVRGACVVGAFAFLAASRYGKGRVMAA